MTISPEGNGFGVLMEETISGYEQKKVTKDPRGDISIWQQGLE